MISRNGSPARSVKHESPDVHPMHIRSLTRMALALGCLTLLALAGVFLALADIHHADENLDAEWAMVRAGLFISVLFTVTAMTAIVRLAKQGKGSGAG